MTRHILLHDGTWQKSDQSNPTNIALFQQCLKDAGQDGTLQKVQYYSGVGSEGGWLKRAWNGVTGGDLDEIIKESLTYLAENYESGDEIVLLGFSRGAYISRTLGGLIYKCGIPNGEQDISEQVNKAYRFYKNNHKPNSAEAMHFRATHSVQDRPKMVLGCFDTVGSLGAPNQLVILPALLNWRHKFHDTRVNRHIKFAFQVAAIDEQRKNFPLTPMRPSEESPTKVEQIWVAGHHGCAGGGTKEYKPLSDISAWHMIDKLEKEAGIGFDRIRASSIFGDHNALHRPEDDFRQDGIWKAFGLKSREIEYPTVGREVVERIAFTPYAPENLGEHVEKIKRNRPEENTLLTVDLQDLMARHS